jgi:hypothetical protein
MVYVFMLVFLWAQVRAPLKSINTNTQAPMLKN